jgi:hypothetical protein
VSYRDILARIAALPEPKPRVVFDTTDPEKLARFEKIRPFVESIALDVQRFATRARTHHLLYGLCLVCDEPHDFTEHSAEECVEAMQKEKPPPPRP